MERSRSGCPRRCSTRYSLSYKQRSRSLSFLNGIQFVCPVHFLSVLQCYLQCYLLYTMIGQVMYVEMKDFPCFSVSCHPWTLIIADFSRWKRSFSSAPCTPEPELHNIIASSKVFFFTVPCAQIFSIETLFGEFNLFCC